LDVVVQAKKTFRQNSR